MVNQLKIYAVEDLKARLSEAKVIALVDYQGLSANQFAEMRRAVKEAGGQIQVVKNRLLLRALAGLGIASGQSLQGQTAVVWGVENEVEPLQVIKKLAKDWEKPEFRWGIYQKRILSQQELKQLANLPSREVLEARLVGQLAAPLQGLVYNLKYWPQKLVLVLKALKEKEAKA